MRNPTPPYEILNLVWYVIFVFCLGLALCLGGLFVYTSYSYAMDVSDYNQVTLTKKSDPAPYCSVTKFSDNGYCLRCHEMVMVDGKPKFGLKEIPNSAGYDLPYRTKIYTYKVNDETKMALYYTNEGTDSSVLRSISKYMYEHPEFTRFIMEINSYGGSVMDAWRGVGIIEEMRRRGIEIETRSYGIAASAGTILLISGDQGKRFVNPHAEIMLHKLWTFAMFKIDDPDTSEDQAALMRHLQGNINNFIISRTDLTLDILDSEMYKKDWWITGQEAIELGIVDGTIR